MKKQSIEKALLAAGVKHLKDFGYPGANEQNIMTDYVYRAFFKSMLEGTINDVPASGDIAYTVKRLIKQIDEEKNQP